ncbi:MAG: DUF6448 family protein [Syntrophomonadaceae bacterium]
MKKLNVPAASLFIIFLIFYLLPVNVNGHCDGIKGPVVTSAKKALETGNVNYALIWVSRDNEEAIKTLFNKALEVRKLNQNARELADMYFFETLVRLHRNGEGEPYNGLKMSDKDVPAVIHAADMAIETGKQDELLQFFKKNQDKKAVANKLKDVLSKKEFDINNLADGRSYVKSYTEFIHYAAELSGSKEPEGREKSRHNSHS